MEESMVSQDKKLNAQKYFIFKMIEYFRNSYNVLQNKKYDSLIAMFEEIVDILDEINRSKVDTSYLQKSLENLLEAFKYQWTNHPLINHSFLKKDMINLLNKIKTDKENDNNYYISLYNSITSMLKKINKNEIVKLYLDIVRNEVFTFGEMDKILDSFVSELLYQGYSLKYLEEWYVKEIHPLTKSDTLNCANVEKIFDVMSNLACDNKKFRVLFQCKLPKGLQYEIDEQRGIRIKELFVTNGNVLIYEFKERTNEEEKSKYLYTEVMVCDKYKAIEIIKNSIESYSEIYKILMQSSKSVINEKTIFYITSEDHFWEKVVLEDIIHVNNKMVAINKQERNDIQDLILLRRQLNNTGEQYPDISIIERTIEITKNALDLSSGNKLLNIWSGLEYLSTFYYKEKIIERARTIIPRVICLYYIKNKLNILWDRMQYYRYRGESEFVKSCLDECCKEANSSEYDIVKFSRFLSDTEKAKKLCEQFWHNIIIQREISEINVLLQNKDGITLNTIKDLNELIKQDLNRIYRIRNKLVHSGNNIPENIDLFTYRLYRYINILLSILIYHIKRNQKLTITEILYSIVETYDCYINFLSSLEEDKAISDIKELVSPRYLYL
jgi:hypothetical protein